MKKTRKSDYIILALVCMITLNIGAIVIGRYSSIKQISDPNKNNIRIVTASINYIKENININEILKKTINSLFPMITAENENKDSIEVTAPEFNEVDEETEYISEKDIFIDSLDEYESLIIVKDSDGITTVENIPELFMINKIKVDREKPYILMYHTHATESYLIAKDDNYRSSDKKHNVVGIGSIISTVLEANEHKVEHIETYHDLPSYNKSYSRSLNTVNNKKQESDNFKILLDIHRDAVADTTINDESLTKKSKIDINGKSVATFSLVVGPDSPNKEQILNFARYIKAVSDALYPNLCKGILIKPAGKYNQHISDYSALIEVGYNFNTMDEANEGAKLVGEILTLAINSIIEE